MARAITGTGRKTHWNVQIIHRVSNVIWKLLGTLDFFRFVCTASIYNEYTMVLSCRPQSYEQGRLSTFCLLRISFICTLCRQSDKWSRARDCAQLESQCEIHCLLQCEHSLRLSYLSPRKKHLGHAKIVLKLPRFCKGCIVFPSMYKTCFNFNSRTETSSTENTISKNKINGWDAKPIMGLLGIWYDTDVAEHLYT